MHDNWKVVNNPWSHRIVILLQSQAHCACTCITTCIKQSTQGRLQWGFWGFQKPVWSDQDTLIEQSVTLIEQSVQIYRSSVASYEVVNKNLCELYQWKLSVSGQHPTILRCWLFFLVFTSYAFDQKPVTKNPGAAYATLNQQTESQQNDQ